MTLQFQGFPALIYISLNSDIVITIIKNVVPIIHTKYVFRVLFSLICVDFPFIVVK